MAPAPAAGKAASSSTPRTPTKLGRKPQSSQTSKLNQGESAEDQTKKTDEDPVQQIGDAGKKATTETKDAGKKAAETKDDATKDDTTKEVSDKASEAAETSKKEASDKTSEAAETGKKEADAATSDAKEKSSDLKEQAPQPIDEDEDDDNDKRDGPDATAGAEAADDATDDATDNATEKAGDLDDDTTADTEETQDQATDKADDAKSSGAGVLNNAKGLAGRASNLAGKSDQQAQEPIKSTEDTTDEVEDTADEVKDTTDEVEDTTDEVKDTADDAKDTTDDAKDTTDEAKDTADEAKDEAKDTTDEAKDTADDAADLDVPGLEILKGLEADEEGIVHDKEGNPVGKLVEGDAEDLVGYTIGDEGEILDEDGDLVGRCEILPEKEQQLLDEAKEKAAGQKLPDVNILKGLSCDATGLVFNDDGDAIGQLVDGEAEDLQGKEINEKGEVLDDDGNVIGKFRVTEEAAYLVDQDDDNEDADEAEDAEEADQAEERDGEEPVKTAGDATDAVKDTAEDAADEAGEAVDDAADEAKDKVDEVEDELPGVDALAGQEINSEGEIVNDEGDVLARIEEGVDLDKVKGLTVNEKGEVVDEDGTVLGKVELAEGAAEKLKEQSDSLSLDLRILEGLKVNKKGKVLDEEGEEIGKLTEGEAKDCAGKTINDRGEVLDKNGKAIGKVEIVPGEAADEAMKILREKLDSETPKQHFPGLEILEGLKVNKKGKILDEEGDAVGELVDGDAAECAGKRCNDKGEVLDADGNVIGRVKTLAVDGEGEDAADAAEDAAENAEEGAEAAEEGAEDAEEGAEDAEEGAEDAAENEGDELPPLSILDGLTCNKSGKILDKEGNIVGELTEGDAKKISKAGITADDKGQFWDNKGKVIGRSKTVPREDRDDEAPFAGLEGLIVVKGGLVEDENGNTVGKIVEGDAKKLVGRAVDEDGDIIDKKGSVVGHCERYEEEEPEAEPEAEAIDLSSLAGKTVNKQGNVIGEGGVPVARLVEGNPKELAGRKLDEEGQIWNDSGKVIGRVELIPANERESKPEGVFAGLEGLRVVPDGKVADEDGNIVGQITEGNAKRLLGLAVDEDGDIVDKYGNVKGHAEPLEEEEVEEEKPADLSILDGKKLNKQGFVVNEEGIPLGKLVEGNVKELAGLKCDGEGLIHGDTGKVVGRCELIPDNERVAKPEGAFAGLEGLKVVKDGKVEDANGNTVGKITEGDAKKLVGHTVDEDGDIIDKFGNVKGHAEPFEEEEEAEADLSSLNGCTVNKAGNVVDSSGAVVGKVAEGDVKSMIGKKVDGKGQIWDNSGNVIGRAELAKGSDSTPEGPFAGFDDITVAKDGTIVNPAGQIVGRLTEGDPKKLVGYKVDADGEISDKSGNTIGKAERWEPEEKERRASPMSGLRVNKEGEVRDQNGDVIGRLTAGDLGHCSGFEIDDNGYVVDNDGNKVGEVTLLENIHEEEPEEEETEEDKQKKQDSEVAEKMANICQQTLERIQPVCKQITEHIEKADRTPREELDEEKLVNDVKPLIEEGGRILQECNGSLRGLDPDGRIASQAKGRASSREATPEENRLADCLKELTSTVVTTIDNAKKRINDMPHAKKKLNPLWGLLTQPLFQILAAVGLLLTGVLGLVGQLLNGLGLGPLLNGLLGGLGINKLFKGLGLGGISDALTGKKKSGGGGGGASSIPIVGGLFGGKK